MLLSDYGFSQVNHYHDAAISLYHFYAHGLRTEPISEYPPCYFDQELLLVVPDSDYAK